jgi:DNA repair ATPase RecN
MLKKTVKTATMLAIEAKIDMVTSQAQETISTKLHYGSDEHLDLILEYQSDFSKLTNSFKELNDALWDELSSSPDNLIPLKRKLKGLLSSSNRILGECRKRNFFFRDLKTYLQEFHDEYEQLREILHDLEFKADTLNNDPELKELFSKVKNLR